MFLHSESPEHPYVDGYTRKETGSLVFAAYLQQVNRVGEHMALVERRLQRELFGHSCSYKSINARQRRKREAIKGSLEYYVEVACEKDPCFEDEYNAMDFIRDRQSCEARATKAWESYHCTMLDSDGNIDRLSKFSKLASVSEIKSYDIGLSTSISGNLGNSNYDFLNPSSTPAGVVPLNNPLEFRPKNPLQLIARYQ